MTRPAPAFPIGLIALDLDGTLIDDDLVLRPRTIGAIAAAGLAAELCIDDEVGATAVLGRVPTLPGGRS